MITSFRNPLIKRIKKLQRRRFRRAEGAFFVEGIRSVLAALEQDAPVETLVYAPELLQSEVALAAVDQARHQGLDVVAVSAPVFGAISQRENPVGFGAIVRFQVQSLAAITIAAHGIYVALQDVGDPGNLGTIVRTVDGAGASAVILIGDTTDPYHPTAVRASMGTLFNVTVAEAADMDALWAWAQANDLHTLATSANAPHRFWDVAYAFPLLLLLGSEGAGLSTADLERADLAVSIPMYGTASSLNLAVATGLLLYELRRQL